MSLLMEVLNKLKGGKKRASVHPFFLKGKDNLSGSSNKRVVILTGLALFTLLISYIAYYLLAEEENLIIKGQYTRQYTPGQTTTAKVKEETVKPKFKESSTNMPQGSGVEVQQEVKKDGTQPQKGKVPVEAETKLSGLPPPPPKPEQLPLPERKQKPTFDDLVLEADTAFREGKLLRSIKLYEKALSVKQDNTVINNLVVLYTRVGEPEKAENLVRKYPEGKIIYSYVVELVRIGRTPQAFKIAEEMVKFDNTGFVSFSLGYIHESTGNFAAAGEFYRKAFEISPENYYFAFNYARILEANGKFYEARRIYQQLADLSLENDDIRNKVKERLRSLDRLIGG